MTIPSFVSEFLESVKKVAAVSSSLRAGDTLIPLYHPFWSRDEIIKGLTIKKEWDVPDDLIPFYGDWHDVLCVSAVTGEIVLLDDERMSISIWKNGDDFLNCLSTDTINDEGSSTREGSGIVEDQSWLDI